PLAVRRRGARGTLAGTSPDRGPDHPCRGAGKYREHSLARRERYGERRRRARDPCPRTTSHTATRQRELHVASGAAGRERTLRPRGRLVHRRARAETWALRDRAQWHDPPRRDRRHAEADAGQTAPLSRDADVPPRRR